MVIRIDRIAAGGDGVGRLPDGRVAFVPRTAPGDVVRLAQRRDTKRFTRARIGEIVEPSRARVTPRCAHYERDRCGGCQLQHLSDPAQRAARAAVVGDALRRIGKLDLSDPELESTEVTFHYRASITLHRSGTGHFGFHRFDNPGAIFSLDRCEIAQDPLNRCWAQIRHAAVGLPRSIDRLTLRTDPDGSIHTVLYGGGSTDRRGIERVVDQPAWSGDARAWWCPTSGPPREVGKAEGKMGIVPVTTFLQSYPRVADRVRTWVLGELEPANGEHWWDLYSGIGEMSARLVERGASVESIEIDPDAVACARSRPIPGLSARIGAVERVIADLREADGAILNPPRGGLDPDVIAALGSRPPRRMGYISCDPATLARDLSRMIKGFRIRGVRAFDQFPQTAHVEVAALLEAL